MKLTEKNVRVILKDNAKIEFEKINEIAGEQAKKGIKNSFEMQLIKSIKTKINLIKENPFYGDNIKKNQIPLIYKNKVKNMFRVELNNFWRMLYTLRGDEIEVICFILEICDHKKYNKIFGYKK
ncbi:MAG: hypothetical protein ACOCUU_01680 [Nanoarchaeota archaeon]